MKQLRNSGFTYVELLVVAGVLAILVLVVTLAVDPAAQFRESRNARRWSDANSLSTALYRSIIENGKIPEGIDQQERQIGTATTGCNTTCSNAGETCLNLGNTLKPYLENIPIDPSTGTPERTGYSIQKNEDNVIIIHSCSAENGAIINISR